MKFCFRNSSGKRDDITNKAGSGISLLPITSPAYPEVEREKEQPSWFKSTWRPSSLWSVYSWLSRKCKALWKRPWWILVAFVFFLAVCGLGRPALVASDPQPWDLN
jgi:hypothetical protein